MFSETTNENKLSSNSRESGAGSASFTSTVVLADKGGTPLSVAITTSRGDELIAEFRTRLDEKTRR